MFSAPQFTAALFSKNVNFDDLAYRLFNFQYENNALYHAYVDTLHIPVSSIKETRDIPFLPIGFFKTHEVKTGRFEPELYFESSGTTQTVRSKHYIKDISLYEQSFRKGFEICYGDIEEYIVLGLLPSYLERNNSSLVYMVHDMIQRSKHSESGFYLHDHEKLYNQLLHLEKRNKKIVLIGVTFALLDFAEKYSMQLENTIIMETGGMKGRREEWTREEVHQFLKERLGVRQVHSEYGMTELLSQAYSKKEGIFYPPFWMRIFLRDETDPLQILPWPKENSSQRGIINMIDLSNIYSCAFIATEDAGRIFPDGSFQVLGRIDNSDLRGCSLMTS